MFSKDEIETAVTLMRTFAPRSEVSAEERDGHPVVRFVSDYANGFFASWEHLARFLVAFCPPAPVA